MLVGVTAGSRQDFVLGGVGIGRVSSGYSTADSPHSYPNATAIVYSIEAHPKAIFGLGATVFGALGPRLTRYTGIAITVNPGWFGD